MSNRSLLTTFESGQYVYVQINLQKLGIPYEKYHLCAYFRVSSLWKNIFLL